MDSNTSHVPIYLLKIFLFFQDLWHSNTSHVPIYLSMNIQFLLLLQFKYISCSNLSRNRFTTSRSKSYSNTSHVPIYQKLHRLQNGWKNIQIHLMFQFIQIPMEWEVEEESIQIHLMFQFIDARECEVIGNILFKYISCSNLSYKLRLKERGMGNSNTSHVPIYPNGSLCSCARMIFKYISCSNLSKTRRGEKHTSKSDKFKYISCSNLSKFVDNTLYRYQIQIHLMFQFIGYSSALLSGTS